MPHITSFNGVRVLVCYIDQGNYISVNTSCLPHIVFLDFDMAAQDVATRLCCVDRNDVHDAPSAASGNEQSDSELAEREYRGDPPEAVTIDLRQAETKADVQHIFRMHFGEGNLEHRNNLTTSALLQRPDYVVIHALDYTMNEIDRRKERGFPNILSIVLQYVKAKGYFIIDREVTEAMDTKVVYNMKFACEDMHLKQKRLASTSSAPRDAKQP